MNPTPAMNPKKGHELRGLVAATFTPMAADGEINLDVIEPYVDYLINEQGVKNVFVNGTTGESMSLTLGERKALAKEWCLQGRNKLAQVIVHVGCMSLKDSQELARHAVEVEADGISVIAPSFFKPSTAEALRTYLQAVASVAPSMPFYYYHIPALTGVNVLARDVLEGITDLIPSFCGVKFSGTDLMDLGLCVSPDDWSVLYGVDEQLLGGLAMGACGAVGSTYNYTGHVANLLLSAFDEGDLVQARALQFKVQHFLSGLFKIGFGLPMNKQLMGLVSGLALGPPRLPLQPCLLPSLQASAQTLRDGLLLSSK